MRAFLPHRPRPYKTLSKFLPGIAPPRTPANAANYFPDNLLALAENKSHSTLNGSGPMLGFPPRNSGSKALDF